MISDIDLIKKRISDLEETLAHEIQELAEMPEDFRKLRREREIKESTMGLLESNRNLLSLLVNG